MTNVDKVVPAEAATSGTALAQRRREAQRRSCTPRRLSELSEDRCWTVRRRVAEHPNAPSVSVRHLSDDPDKRVRNAIAGRPDLGTAVQFHLASDESRWVRMRLVDAQHDPSLMMALSADPEPMVRDWAAVRCWLVTCEEAYRDHDDRARASLMEWMLVTADERLRLTASHVPLTRVDIADVGLFSDLMWGLARDTNPKIAADALSNLVARGRKEDIAAVCADDAIPLRVGPERMAGIRLSAALHQNCGTESLRLLSRDDVPSVAAAALTHRLCPSSARRLAKRRSPYMRGVLAVMDGWWWGTQIALSESPRRWQDELGALVGRRWRLWVGNDVFQTRLYTAQDAWDRLSRRQRRRFAEPSQAHAFAQRVLADAALRRRYPHAAAISDEVKVVFDGRMRKWGATADHRTMTVRIQRGCASCGTVLHELAHLLVGADPRFSETPPPLGHHGADFAAVMLDLVEVAFGPKERRKLRITFWRHAVPVLRPARKLRNTAAQRASYDAKACNRAEKGP